MTTAPDSYRPAQIILHWVVVIGIFLQFAVNEQIVRVVGARRVGDIPVDTDVIFAWMHVSVGSAIFVAVIARLYMRFRYGVPGHAPGTPRMQAKIADIVHWSLYALLLAMVLTGMLTWNGIAPLGDAHFAINIAIFFVALAHALAALFNQFVRKDGTMRRMTLTRQG